MLRETKTTPNFSAGSQMQAPPASSSPLSRDNDLLRSACRRKPSRMWSEAPTHSFYYTRLCLFEKISGFTPILTNFGPKKKNPRILLKPKSY